MSMTKNGIGQAFARLSLGTPVAFAFPSDRK
jgi:hypothetical protein